MTNCLRWGWEEHEDQSRDMVEPETAGCGVQTTSVPGQSVDQGQVQMKLPSTHENEDTKKLFASS